MNTTLTIKNFRIFDENGVTFKMSPITILTGCNSSGKSTLVKAIMTLQSFLHNIIKDFHQGNDIKISKYKLDFSVYPLNTLGNFNNIVNRNSSSSIVTFEYTIYSLMLSKDVTIEMSFYAKDNDELNNGYLYGIKLSCDDTTFYSSIQGKTHCNLEVLKKQGIEFIILEEWYREKLVKDYSNEENSLKVEAYTDEYINSTFNRQRLNDVKKHFTKSFFEKTIAERNNIILFATKSYIQGESIFSIPILRHMKDKSKDECVIQLRDIKENQLKDNFREDAETIIKAFEESEYDNIQEYADSLERDFLTNVISRHEVDVILRDDIWNNHYLFNRDSITASKVTFELFHVTLMEMSTAFDTTSKFKLIDSISKLALHGIMSLTQTGKHPNCFTDSLFPALCTFAIRLIIECLTPEWAEEMMYVSSSRVNVKRLYNLDNHNDFTNLLRSYFDGRQNHVSLSRESTDNLEDYYVAGTFSSKWVKKFDIGEDIHVIATPDGLGVKIMLYRTDGTKTLLADEGYGITQLVSILLQIETAILNTKNRIVRLEWRTGSAWSIHESTHVRTISIEEPEIHLHPNYQSLLAEMFYEAYNEYNIHCIIETHSEYFIRKSQLIVSEMNLSSKDEMEEKNPFRVYYIPRDQKPYDMNYDIHGWFKKSFGPGFYDEAVTSHISLIKKRRG